MSKDQKNTSSNGTMFLRTHSYTPRCRKVITLSDGQLTTRIYGVFRSQSARVWTLPIFNLRMTLLKMSIAGRAAVPSYILDKQGVPASLSGVSDITITLFSARINNNPVQ